MHIGILGGGQLGWMTILEGRKLGLSFSVLDKDPHAPASRVADNWFPPDKSESFFKVCDVITYEFEHIEDQVLETVKDKLMPGLEPIRLKKSRSEEKRYLYRHGYPVPRFKVTSLNALEEVVKEVGPPCVVKSNSMGYDGKGQYRVLEFSDLERVRSNHPEDEVFVVEELVNFVSELSAVGVRDSDGRVKVYPPTLNIHEEGILICNWVMREVSVREEVEEVVSSLMEDLSIVGLLAVEFFLTSEGGLLINEFAPRPHNTGHYTLDGAYTSQFENLLRALTGLPLGSTDLKVPAGMVNILGSSLSELNLKEILAVEGSKLYWYGKEKKPRRKMGHVNVVSHDENSLKEKVSTLLSYIYHREYTLI